MRGMKRWRPILLFLVLALALSGMANAVTFTEDGGMIVNGEGTDDLEAVDGVDSGYQHESVVTPPPDEEKGEKGPGPTFAKSEPMEFYYVCDDGSLSSCDMVTLGTVNSLVLLDGELQMVNTCRLTYETEKVEDEQRYAMINAQRNGYATMHLSASVKSPVVNRIMTNRVALVLDVGTRYTKVWVDNCQGYIQTTSLTFLQGIGTNTQLAKMSLKGKIKSNNTINIHMNGKSKSRILDDVRCGTPMTVFSVTDDGWTEIETDGWHAWVLSQFVTYDDQEGIQ